MASKKPLPPSFLKNADKNKGTDSKSSKGDAKGMRKCPHCGKSY